MSPDEMALRLSEHFGATVEFRGFWFTHKNKTENVYTSCYVTAEEFTRNPMPEELDAVLESRAQAMRLDKEAHLKARAEGKVE